MGWNLDVLRSSKAMRLLRGNGPLRVAGHGRGIRDARSFRAIYGVRCKALATEEVSPSDFVKGTPLHGSPSTKGFIR
jgi:hypothetical protein